MRGFSQELIFALLFGAVLLVQFLYRQLRRKAASMRAEREAKVPPATVASTAMPVDAPPRPVAGPVSTVPPRVAPRTKQRARRFSRAALMPNRRALQNAIVIAAILQPCHASRARDIE